VWGKAAKKGFFNGLTIVLYNGKYQGEKAWAMEGGTTSPRRKDTGTEKQTNLGHLKRLVAKKPGEGASIKDPPNRVQKKGTE